MNSEILIYLLLALNAAILVISILALKKVSLVAYLLDQPVVKEISSSAQLNLKKVDRSSIDSPKTAKSGIKRVRPTSSGGKDSRGRVRGPRDRNKSPRSQRGNIRGGDARGTVVQNQSAQTVEPTPKAEMETAPKSSSNGHVHSHSAPAESAAPKSEFSAGSSHNTSSTSGGRRRLPARGESPKAEGPASESSAPQSSSPAPESSSAQVSSAHDASNQYGRRTKMKKSPVFED